MGVWTISSQLPTSGASPPKLLSIPGRISLPRRPGLVLESVLPAMEQASRFLASLDNLRESCDAGDIVCAAWKGAVGKRIAEHTRASKLVRDTLVVEVQDWLWQRNLKGLSRQIVTNIERVVGPGIVADVEFRIMPPRRGPQVAQSSVPAFELSDDASGIVDPVLRRIYRSKRNKEIA